MATLSLVGLYQVNLIYYLGFVECEPVEKKKNVH